MGHPLEAIDWRLERADEHLATLNREREAVLHEENRVVVGHFERDTSEYVFRFKGKMPEPRIGIIVGELAHNLRSALDNLLWQLVLLRGGAPTRQTQFPIYERRKGYDDAVSRGVLRGICADDRAAIEAVQPYKHGGSASEAHLALLSWLNNVDKHRFLHVGCAFPVWMNIDVYYHSMGGALAGKFPWNPLLVKDVGKILDVRYVPELASDDSAELMRVSIDASGPDPQMDVRRDAPIEVALSDREHALSFSDLKIIRQYVGFVIDGFRPRFDVVAGTR